MKDGVNSIETLLNSFKVTPDKNFVMSSVGKFFDIFKETPEKNISSNNATYIETNYQNNLLMEMLETYQVADFCLIGPRGCGKSLLIERLAEMLGKEIESIVLYQDMTARDLLQQRTTLDNGDTIWQLSPLIKAAIEGKIAVLDGIHRIHPSTLSVLHRYNVKRF